ncbi:Uncharacterized protein conserved in bacteria [Elizabethkingia miricola]|jgi:uncharacterized protein (DUF2147 family)|uniref:DUF2147 domain-containing protein n=8 Tax=Elizabethkingia TaxID=308865 RepID=A0A077EFB9_9FLAO|nr:hypothetical protein BD94_0435 [Elizabethkingia anophelis NUHP1]AJW63601.1 hypothetical protein VO54_02129 [Elizabethkingia miricola]AKH93176.1 signal peptide protein [Elizabethkingia anophelis FMS-007]ELR79101.1 hypothetical protein D505_10117 [Elizabethkingia anophelis R26]EQB91224.1 signal peptide protein [Elizabethkingia anophelis 502]KMU61060.1 hypothetical protein EZBTHKR_3243 [Elizabethkingia anophelis]
MKMKKIIFSLVAVFFSVLSYAQIEGKWKTIDDETGKPKSIVEIFKKSDGKYYGKVIQLLIKPADPNCSGCKDDRKDKPILGMEVIRGLSKDGSEFTKGTITDPKNGKTYKCTIKKEGEDKLNVRGYIGFSALGRSQTWYKVD